MSFPRYPAYRDSGVEWLGQIPSHWELNRLGMHFTERREKVSDKDFPPLSVTKGGVVPQLDTAAKTDDGDNRKLVRAGDFVINSRSDRKGSAGVASTDGSVSLINTVICPDGGVSGSFAHHLLRSIPFQEEYYRYGKGIVADLWSTNFSEMRNITVAVPPQSEQSGIVEFLDRETANIDALVAEQEQLITLLKEKRQAVISHAVTKGLNPTVPMKDSGVEWLGTVPAHWAIAALNYRYEVLLGKMLDEKKISGNHLAPYLRNVDVQWDRINIDELPQMDFDGSDLDRYGLRAGDLLVCEGGDVGRAAIWQGELSECYYQKALHRLRPRDGSSDLPRFQFYLMQAAAKLDVFTGGQGKATIVHLTAEALRRYRFAYPGRAEQERIVAHLDQAVGQFDELINEAANTAQLLQERRSALISAAVTGQIDVRGLLEQTAKVLA